MTNNQSMKFNRAITGATVVSGNSYAVVSYQYSGLVGGGSLNQNTGTTFPPVILYFGAGQSIPATIVVPCDVVTQQAIMSLTSGYELINT